VFDKAIDDRLPRKKWQQVSGPLDLVLFEGWCVGAQAQTEEELAEPVNSLESDEDPDQSWRHYVNRQLQQEYNKLFNELDFLVMLKIPGMSSVMEWRGKQEHKLAQTTSHGDQKIMDAKALQRFIMHYERLTRSMLTEMSDRADLVFEINANHQINGVQINTPF
jgi:D-glycerate 3-kinase